MSATQQSALALPLCEQGIRHLDWAAFQLIKKNRLTTADVTGSQQNATRCFVSEEVGTLGSNAWGLLIQGGYKAGLEMPSVYGQSDSCRVATDAVMQRIAQLAPRPRSKGSMVTPTTKGGGHKAASVNRKRPPAKYAKDRVDNRAAKEAKVGHAG